MANKLVQLKNSDGNNVYPCDYSTRITPTYIQNSLLPEDVATNIIIHRTGRHSGFIYYNVGNTIPSGTALTEVCKFEDITLERAALATLATQNGQGTVLFQMQTNGTVSIGNYSGVSTSGYARAQIPVCIN